MTINEDKDTTIRVLVELLSVCSKPVMYKKPITDARPFLFDYDEEQPPLRLGQAMMSALQSVRPDIARNVHIQTYNPFYDDKLLDSFFLQVIAILKEEKK